MRNYKNQNKKKSLLAHAIESIKESDNDDYNFDKLNKNLFRKTFNKSFKRNSSLKISEYNQKKFGQTFKSEKNNSFKSKN